MTYRVVNLSTGEIRAELHDIVHARKLADQLAAESGDAYAVVELVTVYETRPVQKKEDGCG